MAAVSSSPTNTATTVRPRRLSSSLARPTLQTETASANGTGARYGQHPVHAERSCAAEVFWGENGGHRSVSTEPSVEKDHRQRHIVLKMFDEHVHLSFLRIAGTRVHGGRQIHFALTSRHTRLPHPLQSRQKLRVRWLLRRFLRYRPSVEGEIYIREHVLSLLGSSTSVPAPSATTRGHCSY